MMRWSRFACIKAATGRYGRRIGRLKLAVGVFRRSQWLKLAAEKEKIIWPDNLHGMSVRQLVQPDIGICEAYPFEFVQIRNGFLILPGGHGRRMFQSFDKVSVKRIGLQFFLIKVFEGGIGGSMRLIWHDGQHAVQDMSSAYIKSIRIAMVFQTACNVFFAASTPQ